MESEYKPQPVSDNILPKIRKSQTSAKTMYAA